MFNTLREYILIRGSGLFDTRYYLQTYPDVRKADIDPLMHFIKIGWMEERNPSRQFRTNYYLVQNPDVHAARMNPLVHYIRYGKKEGREAQPHSMDQNADPVNEIIKDPDVENKSGSFDRSTQNAPIKRRRCISVIIPTRNGGMLFKEQLTALKNQKYAGEMEIIVIDSESSDETCSLAEEFGAKVISINKSEFNHGLTRNRAIDSSKGDLMVLLSQDSIPGDNTFISNLTSAFSDPLIAGAYARQVPRENADIFTKRDLNNWLTGRTNPEVRSITNWDTYDGLPPLEKFFFCNFDNVASCIRREVWEAIPFTRNDFGEDIDWAQNVLEAGWKIAYVPSAFVVHSHEKSIPYEYSRAVLCHKKLYMQFGICIVPSVSIAILNTIKLSVINWNYAKQCAVKKSELAKIALTIPWLSLASFFGQYVGAKRGKKLINQNRKKLPA